MTVFSGGAIETSGIALLCIFAIFLAGYLLAAHDASRRANKLQQEHFANLLTQDNGMGATPNSPLDLGKPLGAPPGRPPGQPPGQPPGRPPGRPSGKPPGKPSEVELGNHISRVYREVYGQSIDDATLKNFKDDYKASNASPFNEVAFRRMLIKQRRWEFTNIIKAAFAKVLRRLPTQVETNRYIDMFYTGTLGTQAQLEDMLLVDPEYAEGGITAADKVDPAKKRDGYIAMDTDSPRYQKIIEIFKSVLDRHPKAAELEFYNSLMSRTPSFDEHKLRSALMSSREYDMLTMNQKNDAFNDLPGKMSTRQLEFTVEEMYKRVHGHAAPDRATAEYMTSKFKSFNMDEALMLQYIRSLKMLEDKGEHMSTPDGSCGGNIRAINMMGDGAAPVIVRAPVLDTSYVTPRTIPPSYRNPTPVPPMDTNALFDKYTATPNTSVMIMDKISLGAPAATPPVTWAPSGSPSPGSIYSPGASWAPVGTASPAPKAPTAPTVPTVPTTKRASGVQIGCSKKAYRLPDGTGKEPSGQPCNFREDFVNGDIGSTMKSMGTVPLTVTTTTAPVVKPTSVVMPPPVMPPQVMPPQVMPPQVMPPPVMPTDFNNYMATPTANNETLFCQAAPRVFQAPNRNNNNDEPKPISLERMLCSRDMNMLDTNRPIRVYDQRQAVVPPPVVPPPVVPPPVVPPVVPPPVVPPPVVPPLGGQLAIDPMDHATAINPMFKRITDMRLDRNAPTGIDADYVRFLNERKTYDKDLLSLQRMGGVYDVNTGHTAMAGAADNSLLPATLSQPSSSSLQGTPIWDSMKTEVGSILPKFKYEELPPST